MSWLALVLGLVALQRMAELMLAERNTRRLLARGGREVGAGHYRLFILLHASWLVAIALSVPWQRAPSWPLLGVFLLLQLARVWVIVSLGPYWTTRIITVDGAPLAERGPYRYLRHPNYWIVAAEIAVLPLTFGVWQVALIWSALNALLLRHRICIEDAALRSRQTQARDGNAAALR